MDDDIIIYYNLIKKYNINNSQLECSINIKRINSIYQIEKKIVKIDNDIKTFKNNFKKDTKKWSLNDSINKNKIFNKLSSIDVINTCINKLKNEKDTYINNINDLINKIINNEIIEIYETNNENEITKIYENETNNENKITKIYENETNNNEIIEIYENSNEDWENNIINS